MTGNWVMTLVQDMTTFPSAQVLFVGMATVRTDWGILQHEVCEGLAITFVGAHPNSALVLQRVWPHNREIIMRAMLALYQQEDANIARVLEVCEELEALTVVLDGAPFDFAIELAALAAQRERLNLEKWLQERTSYHQLPFLTVRGSAMLFGALQFQR